MESGMSEGGGEMNTPSDATIGLARNKRQAAFLRKLVKINVNFFLGSGKGQANLPQVMNGQKFPIFRNFDDFALKNCMQCMAIHT